MTSTIERLDEAQQADIHYISIPSVEGDLKTEWDPTDAVQVAVAQSTFEDALEQGMTAYRVDADGVKSGQTRTFDPEAGRYVFIKPLAGG